LCICNHICRGLFSTSISNEIILNARAIIDEVKTADGANDALGSLKALEVVGESKTVAWLMLKRHCASIGLEMKDGKFTVKV